MISGLLLQISLSVHQAYLYVFVGVSLALLVYKGIMLPYPPTGALTWDFILVFLYYTVASARLFHASKGNKTWQVAPLALAIIFSVPIVICNAYFLQLQTYVLRLDGILNGVALTLVCGEMLLTLLALLSLVGANNRMPY